MNCINVLIGISGSGKSTIAKQMFDSLGPDKSVVIGRDKIRELLFSYNESNIENYYNRKDFSQCEEEVSRYETQLIKTALRAGRDVISDNTNLKISYLNKYKHYGVLVNYIPVECSLELAQQRNQQRLRKVDPVVIIRQSRQFSELKKKFDFSSYEPTQWKKPPHNPKLPDAYIFDIDGTLAIKGDRSAYDWSKVSLDTQNKDIVSIQTDLACISINNHDRLKIIICSGRDEICREDTKSWLMNKSIIYDELHMRPQGNTDKDYIIKERMWKDISERYNIVAMFDDRDQVVFHARNLGFTVCQVAYGDF